MKMFAADVVMIVLSSSTLARSLIISSFSFLVLDTIGSILTSE